MEAKETLKGVPKSLATGPQGPPPAPPVDTAAQILPFEQLEWKDFERLCLRLAEFEGEAVETRLYGTPGQDQQGIDLFSRQHGGSYATYQCRRRQKLGEADFTGAVADFREDEWAERSSRFVFCTSASMVRTELARSIESQAEVLRQSNIELEVWDAERLSGKLKAHPGLVEDFFGRAWAERFSRPEAAKEMQSRELAGDGGLGQGGQLRVVILDWAPTRIAKELRALRETNAQLFASLTEAIGEPPRPATLTPLLASPPAWLLGADAEHWALLARICENAGAWAPARTAWEGAAERQPSRVGFFLIAAASAAGIEEDRPEQQRLLARARSLDPEEPRVKLAEIDDTAPPEERLAALAQLHSDDPDVRSLISGHRSLAALLLPDLKLAATEVAQLKADAPQSALAIATEVNLAVQRGRLAVIAAQPLDAPELRDARIEALKLRDRLLRQRRFEESARLLMMAADASALMGERKHAAKLLRNADPAELVAETGAEVLAACAAGRALDFRLGLVLISSAPEGPGKRLIEAECLEEVGSAAQRTDALKTLEEIVTEDGPNSSEAAFIRLAATLGGRRTPWSEKAARYLREHGHVKAAINAEVFYLARWHSDYKRAEELLEPHLDQLWAKAARLRLAATRKAWEPLRKAADAVMAAGPSQQLRLEAGRSYAMAKSFVRAQEVLLGVARDPGAPEGVRIAAYRSLLPLVGVERGDWRLAKDLLQEWIELDPADPQASSWAPTVANRLARQF